jgi:hypothetical protein
MENMGTTETTVVYLFLIIGVLSVAAVIWGLVRGAAALTRFRRDQEAIHSKMEAFEQIMRFEQTTRKDQ